MKKRLIVIVALAGVLLLCSPGLAESPSVLLEKGIYNEETKGDLDAAITIYKKIVDDAQANRKYIAEAQYRLGLCLMKQKKNTHAIETFKKVIKNFPNQKKFVSRAKDQITKSRQKIAGAELSKIVKDAVLTISTCVETDPRVKTSLASLEGLNEKATVKTVAKFLNSDKNTIRRSAIYILWKGPFKTITPAGSELIKLCKHKEGMTRGMAAITLGGRKIDSAFQIISDMTLEDKSPYARRCAAYALGLMGNPAAKSTLEKALNDKNEMVRNNAEAALTMLGLSEGKNIEGERLPMVVMMWIVDAHMEALEQARAKGLRVNTHIYGVDDKFNRYLGGFMTFKNQTGKVISEEIPLGNFGDKKPDFELANEQGAPQKFRLEKRKTARGGRYRLWWTPDAPIQPGQVRLLGYLHKKTKKLPKIKDDHQLKMNNHFGSPVLENFFLVVPQNMAIADESRQYKTKVQRGIFDIYQWQREVPVNTTNEVNVVLRTKPSKKIINLSHDDGKSIGMNSTQGGGHGVKFDAPAAGYKLTAVKLYGSRYGHPKPPKENFSVWLCDAKGKVLEEFLFPYSKFNRSKPRWVTLPIKPTAVPKQFIIFFGFNPHRTKGVYVHYSARKGNNSLMGLPGSKIRKFKKGNWMIRGTVEYAGKTKSSKKVIQLSHDDGKSIGMNSINGGGHGVKFEAPAAGYKLTAVKLYGSRYGNRKPPKENFSVWLCDTNYDVLKKFSFPYSKFKRSKPRWVTLPIKPTAVPKQFVIFFGFSPHRTKGVYVHYAAAKGKNSYSGLPGGETRDFDKGNWMIRAILKKNTSSKPTADAVDQHSRRKLLDAKTLADVKKYERSFAPWFQPEGRYNAATESEKAAVVQRWIIEAESNNFKIRTRAIAALGNVRDPEAVDVLIRIADEPMRNNRPKWLAVRGLGEIGDPKAVPTLIELVDHGNLNVRVFARAALAQITGVYFGTDKAKWRKWWKTNGKALVPKTDPKIISAEIATSGWLKIIDAGNYGKSWDTAAGYFKKAVKRKKWQEMVQTVRGPLGKLISRKLISAKYETSLPGAPEGEYVVIKYRTKFENMKNVIETVTPMKDKDGKWRVSGYFIK